jgi:DNA-binding HxlR family transcriptional regulator
VPVVAPSVSRETWGEPPAPSVEYELSALYRFASSVLFADAKIAENHVQNVFHVDPAK